MVTTPDRRVRRTRQALRDALLDLMAEKGYEAVTIADIIDRADVGRSTFYNHYTDKDDLLRDGFGGLRDLIERPAAHRRPLDFSLPLLRHVHDQQRLVRALLADTGRTPVLRQIERILTEVAHAELDRGGTAPGVPLDAIARYVSGAYLALLEWWLLERPELSPEQANDVFHALVAPGVRATLA